MPSGVCRSCFSVYHPSLFSSHIFFFFFNDTATTEIYTLSLHDALPICVKVHPRKPEGRRNQRRRRFPIGSEGDRKSTRLNSSHSQISYAVFCLKKKKKRHFPISNVYYVIVPKVRAACSLQH